MSQPAVSKGQQRGKLEERYPHPVPPSKLAHVVLRTSRYEQSRAWYATVLSAAPAYENEQLCFMTYDDEHHRVGIINVPQLADSTPAHAGMEHFAFTFDELGHLLATYRRLKRAGIEPFWTINHGPTISMYYRDPDGNKVELQYDVFRTPEDVNAFFASRKYDENFMGIIFDPEQMVRDFEVGVPIEKIAERPLLPPGMTPWDMHRQ
jgi:catechol 2,3-dioxygenase-like lactoylglutathione lyase family enzyme